NGIWRGAAIDHTHTAGLIGGKLPVRFADPPMKSDRLIVHACFRVICSIIALVGSHQTRLCIDIDKQRQVGNQTATRDQVEFVHEFSAKPAAYSLVYKRGIRETVREHDSARSKRWEDALIDILCPAGKHQ